MVDHLSLAKVAPPVTVVPVGAGAKANANSADRTSSRPAPDKAVHDKAERPSEVAEVEERAEAREPTAEQSLSVLDGRRLSILQDRESQRFVYRGVNASTHEIEAQYPSESDLARGAVLRDLAGTFFDLKT